MYRKREREFQYPPGIEKIIEDVIGGGTIDRRDLRNALFNGKSLDELPPIVIVVKDPETGLYHVLKTALVQKRPLPMRQRIKWPRTICSVWVTS